MVMETSGLSKVVISPAVESTVISPLDVSGPHIKALARISRLLKGEDFHQYLIASKDKDDAIAIIEEEEKKH